MTKCTLTPNSGALLVTCPYDDGWLLEFKSQVPYADRKPKYNGKKFVGWLVTPQHGKTVQKLCEKYFNELPLLPQLTNIKPTITQKILDVRYIGATKDRGGDERSSYGWYADGWNVIFSESVLRAWFDGVDATPSEAQTLYSVLGVKRDATADELKAGWKRMIMQWHPDHSKEPNAHEQFLSIQHAYDILKDTSKRERYDAGLALEASLKSSHTIDTSRFTNNYRSPLRCGMILCEGTESMGLFRVSKIFEWQDVKDQYGRTLVSSWPAGADTFEERWV